MQINDLFGAAAAFETVRMPDGTEAAIPTEHAAVIYVNEQPAFRVVCTPQLLPQLALGRLLTEGWIASAEEVEQISVCAEGLKVNIYLNHPLTARRAAAQEVSSCCTDNVALGSPVEVQPLRTVPYLDVQPEWVDTLAAAMSAGLPLYQATHAVHSCFVLHEGRILCACEDIGRHNAMDKAVGQAWLERLPLHDKAEYDYWIAYANYALVIAMQGDKARAEKMIREAELHGYKNGEQLRKMAGIRKNGILSGIKALFS